MRLEERKQAAAVAHRGEVGCELGRMMRVAVEDFDAARLPLALEPPCRARELDDHALDVGTRHARELERRDRGGGVPPVVLAGDLELELDGLELLCADDLRYLREPHVEQLP